MPTKDELPADADIEEEADDWASGMSGVPIGVWKRYGFLAFLWQSQRYSLPKPYVKAIKSELQRIKKTYPVLPPWWGTHLELPF